MALLWPDPLPAYGAVALRPFADSDLPLVAEFSADPYIPLIGSIPVPYTPEAGLAYLARQNQRLADDTGYSFAIADRRTNSAVGGAGLWLAHLSAGRATAGYAIAPSARGRGLATDALVALTTFGWTIPEVHRIELYVEPWNTGSVAVAERAGYRREGLLRSHQEIGGRRRDMIVLARIRA